MEDPHTRFRYSEATTVLGRLVEVWSGEAFDRFLSRRVFGPLDMTDTVFWVEGERRGRLAAVYGPAPDGGLAPVDLEAVPFTERPALLEGAVGLVSSVPDFLRFGQMLLDQGTFNGRRLLKADTAERMTVNGLPADVLKARGGRMGWGLANVNVVMDAGSSSAEHRRVRLGWHRWHGLLERSGERDRRRADDTELACQSRRPAPEIQGDRRPRDPLRRLAPRPPRCCAPLASWALA